MRQASARSKVVLTVLAASFVSACVTSRVEDAREGVTGIREGESIVIMAKSYHLGNETEAKYIRCIENALAKGSRGLNVIPNGTFVDSLFPWFEPRTAPAETKNLAKLMERPGVAEEIAEQMDQRGILGQDAVIEPIPDELAVVRRSRQSAELVGGLDDRHLVPTGREAVPERQPEHPAPDDRDLHRAGLRRRVPS